VEGLPDTIHPERITAQKKKINMKKNLRKDYVLFA